MEINVCPRKLHVYPVVMPHPVGNNPVHVPAHAAERGNRILALSGLILGPAVFAATQISGAPAGLGDDGWSVAGVAGLMAIWWLTQAVPLAATALLPAILFPVLCIGNLDSATAPYAHPLIFLFLGGFVVALTIERWNLHRRIAIAVIGLTGSGPGRLTGGFMLATALLSMWVSNTATALMMLPIAVSVIAFVQERESGRPADPEGGERFAKGLLIAVAYSASIGGLATLIGTPPNAFLAGYMSQTYQVEIGFAAWMLFGLPVSALLLGIAWLVITRLLFRVDNTVLGDVRAGLDLERRKLGRAGRGERMTAVLFAALALAWVFQPVLAKIVPVTDTGIALMAALAAFALPVNIRKREFLLDWSHAVELPWGILLLFGGGLSLAGAIDSTGLAGWLGDSLSAVGGLPVIAALLIIVTLVIFLTELTSNTATAAVLIPLAATLAGSLGLAPMALAAPVALAASCAFMMPVATPPNAIVFSAGRLAVIDMCGAGMVLNLVASVVIAFAALYFIPILWPAG
ncbi:MAG: SLC13 family permease [Proteobacteria bacterium]|nr:SLC13 family permease [Pseudomonadota bacterium]